ncbi:acetoin utilization protein AcuB [Bacillus coahuilensis p1.1.43]|uniref:Acetoin utilization protein AcuB n=1 Tax=Bacillus coahuilensis p1.1.43 TaxID=1150625 RepID=A0A147K6G7_9BACI|nr:acetoin utilization AcuB family protein [Bacillus coahuilensis]KUP05512.1 acetoin utilization protein AcuB [Bacillus coahuilensis p1.1.43]
MLVEEIMNKDVAVLYEWDTIQHAIQLMNEKKIRHLPVINDQNEVIGIVSDRDLKDAAPSILSATSSDEELQKPVKLIMIEDVIYGHPLDLIEEAATLFYDYQIGCLPIVKDHKLIGMITAKDALYTLIKLTGAHQPGSHIEVKVPNKAGMLHEVTSVLKNFHVNIHSVLVYPYPKDEQFKIIVLRIGTMNPMAVIQAFQDANLDVIWPQALGGFYE